MIIQRDLINSLERFLKRQEYIAIIGPRQAGKTTFLEIIETSLIKKLKVSKTHIKKVTFEDRRLLAQFDAEPVLFVRSYLPEKIKGTFYLMIDEFQYSQAGGQKLKLIYDTVKGLKIIITGSSSLDIKAQVGRYLVGRILTFHIHPFNFGEFLRAKDARLEKVYQERNNPFIKWLFEGREFKFKRGKDVFNEEMISHFEEYAVWGGYPAVVLSKNTKERRKVLNDIYSNYILKDIKGLLELATEKNLLLLSQYLATQAGNIVVYQNLSRASRLDYRQTKRHLSLLNETFICTEVKPFFRNRQKELSKNPKVFFYDMGFRNSLMENMNSLDKRSDSGALIENTVFIRLNELCQERGRINFWRTKAGAEVDFVLQVGEEIIPVEVKYSGFDEEKIPRSFVNFVRAFKTGRGIVLTKDYRGRAMIENTEILFSPVYYL
jgi:predicted AAA+ superfamily ATPase